MAGALAKYRGSLAVGLRNAVAYRVSFLMSLAAAVSPVVIQTALWRVIWATGQRDVLFGFTYAQMVAYTVIANLVGRLVRTGFEYELNRDIHTGGLDRYLVKPIGYFGFRLCAFLGAKVLHSAVILALLGVAVGVLAAVLGFPLRAAAVLGFLLSLPVALALTFLLFWCVGLAGFWLTEIGFLFEAVRIVIITASGGIFPLSVLGTRAEAVLRALPFRFTIQLPTEILCGRLSGNEILVSFGLALIWIVALLGLSRLVWSLGVRRFAAVGS